MIQETNLKIEHISCGYKDSFVLKTISFSVKAGDFIGVLGPNGSGKSTLFKGISGLLPLNTGSVELLGKNLQKWPLKEKAKEMAVVSQFNELANVSVFEYVLMGRLPYRKVFQLFESEEDLKAVRHYLKLTGIYGLKEKMMDALSGGEQQLAAIARALVQEPRILLLDEPTSHLDVSHQVEVLNLLQKLSIELKLSVLMIIHDLNLASEYCDKILLMKDGGIYDHGTPDEVLNYKNIERVYSTIVVTMKNPVSGRPAIFLVSNKVLTNTKPEKK